MYKYVFMIIIDKTTSAHILSGCSYVHIILLLSICLDIFYFWTFYFLGHLKLARVVGI